MSHLGWIERAKLSMARRAQQSVPYGDSNPFLSGPFAPAASEITQTDLPHSGEIPADLRGIYARIGPNPISVANPANYHWFLGDGMVHGVRLDCGRATWYRNRWIGTNSVTERLGRPALPGAGPNPAGDTVNTHIIAHAGRIWALVEAGSPPIELDRDLNSVRQSLFVSGGPTGFSAHPHRDAATGELHAICYKVLVEDRIFYRVIGPAGDLRREVAIPVRHGPMVHDCALTASSVVVLDLPITFSNKAALRGMTYPYQWRDNHPARVGLISRQPGHDAVRWFDVDPCYVFHVANAYDLADGTVVLDVVAYPRMFDGSRNGPENAASMLERWTLAPGAGKVARAVRSDAQQEFPRIDDRLTGLPYRYAYTVGVGITNPGPQPLYRHDLHTGATIRHDFGPNHMPAEFVFVPRHAGAAEDDGWLMGYVYDLAGNTSSLQILAAADPAGKPVATIALPARVPMGFHGNWLPDEPA
jgi:carotenoid cleavage dioxygenase